MLADFQNSFSVVFIMKLATKSMSYFQPHLKGVTALPCEIPKNETWRNSAAFDKTTLA